MNKIEFVKACSSRGYTTKDFAKKYAEKHPKEEYSEKDLEDAYRLEEEMKSRRFRFNLGYRRNYDFCDCFDESNFRYNEDFLD